MITVTIFKDARQEYVGFSLQGHAQAGEPGKDIVCAAVSVLAVNTVNSIEQLTEDLFTTNVQSGLLSFTFKEKGSAASHLLIDSFILGIEGVRQEDNENYIKLVFKEV